jgi:hypothetical protein
MKNTPSVKMNGIKRISSLPGVAICGSGRRGGGEEEDQARKNNKNLNCVKKLDVLNKKELN